MLSVSLFYACSPNTITIERIQSGTLRFAFLLDSSRRRLALDYRVGATSGSARNERTVVLVSAIKPVGVFGFIK